MALVAARPHRIIIARLSPVFVSLMTVRPMRTMDACKTPVLQVICPIALKSYMKSEIDKNARFLKDARCC